MFLTLLALLILFFLRLVLFLLGFFSFSLLATA